MQSSSRHGTPRAAAARAGVPDAKKPRAVTTPRAATTPQAATPRSGRHETKAGPSDVPPLILSRSGPTPSERPTFRKGYTAVNGTQVRYTPDWTKQHKIEGDGLLTSLYEYLAKSDKAGEHRLRAAWLPDTVIYDHNFPSAWYSYDAKAREIVKQPGRMLDANSIYEAFSVETEGCDIVAQFYRRDAATSSGFDNLNSSTRRGRTSSRRHQPTETDDGAEPATGVDFFTKETLREFLTSSSPKPDGVLQKFVVPKGKSSSRRNFQLQAVWTPLVALVYKRTTNKLLGDRSASVEQRGTTFDGPPHFSCEARVAAATQLRIHGICCAIVDHFWATESKKIGRLIVYFKEDTKDRLWLLWASSVRVEGDELNPVKVRVPVQLGMKVSRTSHGAEDEDIAHGSARIVERELLRKDLDMFTMTGDMAFARLCGGKMPPPPRPKIPAETPATVDPFHDAAEAATAADAAPGEPSTVPRPKRRGSDDSDLEEYSSDSDHAPPQPTSSAPPAPSPPKDPIRRIASPEREPTPSRGLTLRNEGGVVSVVRKTSPPRRTSPEHTVFFSPRAPFLPTSRPPQPLSPMDERHPLHDRYVELSDQLDGHAGDEFVRAGNTRTSRQVVPKPPTGPRSMPPKPSAKELVKRDLVQTALDCVYETYSTTLNEVRDELNRTAMRRASMAASTGVDYANATEGSIPVDLPAVFGEVLAPDDFDELLGVMGLERARPGAAVRFEIPASALARGRRRDRPAAQVERDVRSLFDRVFDAEGDRIMKDVEEFKNRGTHRFTDAY